MNQEKQSKRHSASDSYQKRTNYMSQFLNEHSKEIIDKINKKRNEV